MKKKETLREIVKLLKKADKERLEIIYEFLRHLLE